MFIPENLDNISISELESLSWYEITSKMGVTSFNLNGIKPLESIAKFIHIGKDSVILLVGCGAGGTAIHLAEKTGAKVYGIDIAEQSIKEAQELANRSPAKDLLHFQVADAHCMPFESSFFDVVITEFVAFFLRLEAFKEMLRILKPRGILALSELMKDPKTTPFADRKIKEAEAIQSEITGYMFRIPPISEYEGILKEVGLQNIHIIARFDRPKTKDLVEAVGGWKNLLKIIRIMIRLMRKSKKLRKMFINQGKVKRILTQNKKTARFILRVVMVGEKTG